MFSMFCLIVFALTDSHGQRNVEMTHGPTAAASVHRFILPPLSFAALSAKPEHVQLKPAAAQVPMTSQFNVDVKRYTQSLIYPTEPRPQTLTQVQLCL